MCLDPIIHRTIPTTMGVALRVEEYSFINDFKTWYPGTYPRIFRAIKGSKFVFDNEVQFVGHARGQQTSLS